jgi:hypothetical protein
MHCCQNNMNSNSGNGNIELFLMFVIVESLAASLLPPARQWSHFNVKNCVAYPRVPIYFRSFVFALLKPLSYHNE